MQYPCYDPAVVYECVKCGRVDLSEVYPGESGGYGHSGCWKKVNRSVLPVLQPAEGSMKCIYPIAKLPPVDDHGNYWWGKPGSTEAPALLPILKDKALLGQYMLSLPTGIVFEGSNLAAFTLKDGHAELKRRLK